MSEDLSKHIGSFMNRWNVGWDAANSFILFKNRLLFLIDKYFSAFVSKELINNFSYLCGSQAPYSASGRYDGIVADLDLRNGGLKDTVIFSSINNAPAPQQLAYYLENLIKALSEEKNVEKRQMLDLAFFSFFQELKDIVDATPSLQMQITVLDREIVTYPAGAKLLDQGLINKNLEWLQDFPEALNPFDRSLSIYMSGDKTKDRDLIDNLRLSLEQLLRKILKNQKSLENQSKELDSWLESHDVHKQVRKLYGQLLFGEYAILQNDVAKHGEKKLLNSEIEYLIYLTGTFMQLLLQLLRDESN